MSPLKFELFWNTVFYHQNEMVPWIFTIGEFKKIHGLEIQISDSFLLAATYPLSVILSFSLFTSCQLPPALRD